MKLSLLMGNVPKRVRHDFLTVCHYEAKEWVKTVNCGWLSIILYR